MKPGSQRRRLPITPDHGEIKGGMGYDPKCPGCKNAVGSLLSLLLWVPSVRGSSSAKHSSV